MAAQPGLWGGGDAYERYMGRWSRRIAPLFLDWLGAPVDAAWVDVGCGTGVLSAAILECTAPRHVAGIDPSAPFLEAARARITDARFTCVQGSGEALEGADARYDAAVSGLVLNFARDRARMVAEMRRVVRPGGRVGLYVWDYAGHMQVMRHFFDAAIELDDAARQFDDGIQAPVCRPGPLAALFEAAGCDDVAVEAIDIPAAFANFDDYWTPFLGGTGSAPKYCASLPAERQAMLREKIRGRLPTGPDGEILLAVRAWAVKGAVPDRR